MLPSLVEDLVSEARRVDERRVLVLTGDRSRCYDAAATVVDAADVGTEDRILVGNRDFLEGPRVGPRNADTLLGTTQRLVVLDWHDTCRPNALGQVVGTIDGGGLLVILAPSLEGWRTTTDEFHESLAVPPAAPDAVGHRYHDRVIDRLDAHRGVAIVDVDSESCHQDGLTDPAPRRPQPPPSHPTDPAFPNAAYEACLTRDQVETLSALESLRSGPVSVVIEADRGRGKSSVAGLAAASLAVEGESVLVTAPDADGTGPLFDRAKTLATTLGVLGESDPTDLHTTTGGRVRYAPPAEVTDVDEVDVLIVDEAAGIPVARLRSYLAHDRLAFVTTVHGYEGAGRGFSVRFRAHLDDAEHDVVDVTMRTPIRYAPGDPVEVWAFNTLLLDARPPVDQLVTSVTPETVSVTHLTQDHLADDDRLLREVFGLLIAAHYRTEPNDLARLLDAPNVTVRALTVDGHVVSVALLAAEGGLDEATREWMYDGGRIRGNMLPDVFASQLRDIDAAHLRGWRVLRVATHAAVRSRGLGSRLLGEVTAEAQSRDLDWVGVGYGATPDLVRFWEQNGFSTVHLATTRNDASGEYSALMLHPVTDAGDRLHARLASWFLERIPGVLGDALTDADPDVVRATLAATDAEPPVSLSPREWRVVAGAAYGPGRYDIDPAPFRRLAVAHLVDGAASVPPRGERLLVAKVLQARSWASVASTLGYHSTGECMRAVGDVYATLCDRYGGRVAREVRARYEE